MPLRTLPRLLLALALLFNYTTAQTCYFPDGITVAVNDVPCNASATAGSPCCGTNNLCMDNGLCLLDGVMSRGSCTDKTWGSGCANYCEAEGMSGGITLYMCSQYGTTFSCEYGNCAAEFQVPGGSSIMLRGDEVQQIAAVGGTSALVVGANTVLHAAPTSTSITTSYPPTTSATISTTPAVQDSNKRYTAADMVGVGVGVGAPLALALAGTLLLPFKQRRRQSQEPNFPQQQRQYEQHQTPQNFSTYSAYRPVEKSEPQTAVYAEIGGGGGMYSELDASQKRQELPNISKTK